MTTLETLEDTLAEIEDVFGAYPDSYTGTTQMVTIWMRDGDSVAYASDNGSRAFHDQVAGNAVYNGFVDFLYSFDMPVAIVDVTRGYVAFMKAMTPTEGFDWDNMVSLRDLA